jgi:branched-chain amino acid transport system substrate-binding protein
VFYDLINNQNIDLVIGEVISPTTLAVTPIAQAANILLISPTATNARLKFAGEYFFQVCPFDATQGDYLARTDYERLNARKAAVLYLDNEYGDGLKSGFADGFLAKGGSIVAIEKFNSSDASVSNQLANIRKNKWMCYLYHALSMKQEWWQHV